MGKNAKYHTGRQFVKANGRDLVRNRKIAKLWNCGLYTMADIGKKHGMSRERVRQVVELVRASGVPVLTHKQWSSRRLEARDFSIKCFRESVKWDIPSYKSPRPELLKRKLGKLGIGKKCEICGWHEVVEVLERHHIDKNRRNNNPNNIAIVCPNCHAIIHHADGDFRTGTKGKRKRGVNFERNKYVREHMSKLSARRAKSDY